MYKILLALFFLTSCATPLEKSKFYGVGGDKRTRLIKMKHEGAQKFSYTIKGKGSSKINAFFNCDLYKRPMEGKRLEVDVNIINKSNSSIKTNMFADSLFYVDRKGRKHTFQLDISSYKGQIINPGINQWVSSYMEVADDFTLKNIKKISLYLGLSRLWINAVLLPKELQEAKKKKSKKTKR